MKIGYDARYLNNNQSKMGYYSRNIVRIMSSLYPENLYHLYNTGLKTPIINKKNTSVVDQKRILSFLSDPFRITTSSQIEQKGDVIFHGLSQELPVGIENTSLKTVVTFHSASQLFFCKKTNAIYDKIIDKKTQNACKIADKIIAINDYSRLEVIEKYKVPENKIEVIYPVCNEIFRIRYGRDSLTEVKLKYNLPNSFILFAGEICKTSGLENILQTLKFKSIDFPLVIVGSETTYSKYLHEFCLNNDLTNRVTFLTNVNYTDLPIIMQMATLFIYPTINDGFSIPVLEALTSNIPVICSKGYGHEEAGGNFSKYINSENTEETGFAILQVLQDSDLQQFMKREGLKHAAKFTDDKIATKLQTLYKTLL